MPNFTLTVTATDETCPGNGILTFNVQPTAAGATVQYQVFLLPDLTSPVATLSALTLGGLPSGTYHVVATQTLNGQSASQSQDVVVDNAIIPLIYTISSNNALCGSDGSITIDNVSGTAISYEITSGPIVMPPQPTPTFTNIPAGVYDIRVYDACGIAVVTTHTVISDAISIIVGDGSFPDTVLPSCSTITATNSLSPPAGQFLSYPISVSYTIYPPDGTPPIIVNHIVPTGNPDGHDLEEIIPFYHGQQYSYDLVVTDPCGIPIITNHIVNQSLSMLITPLMAECGMFFLSVEPLKYGNPFSLTVLSGPPGFNPVTFNPAYPGPFTSSPVTFGDFTHPVPFGDYIFSITDGCGRTAQVNVTLEEQPHTIIPEIGPHTGCGGDIRDFTVSLPGFTFVSAIIIAAPSAYPNPLPDDVSEFIDPAEGLVMEGMPAGTYTIIFVDDCGTTHPDFTFIVPVASPTVSISTREDCEEGFGAVRIRGNGSQLVSVEITVAPPEFAQTLPYDVSFNISGSTFSMAGLPPGMYFFKVLDSCGEEHIKTAQVIGYTPTPITFNLTPHCLSFDMQITHDEAGAFAVGFWLQQFNPVTGTWGHPETGIPYPTGSDLTTTNSIYLENNFNNLNLDFTGEFRIFRTFETFGNGNVEDFNICANLVHEFEFTGDLEITGIQKLTCNGLLSDVIIFAEGVAPLTYRIIEKNFQPFFVDNGTNNVFPDLEPAVYKFAVEHPCGDIESLTTDVALLPSLAVANPAPDMVTCDDSSNDGIATFTLSDRNSAVLGNQSPADYTLTYHSTLDDAATGANPLPNEYTTGNTTVYARVKYNSSTDCFETTSFDLVVNPYPVLQMATQWPLCEGQNAVIVADSGFDSYLWSTGESTSSIIVTEPGTYTVKVTTNYPSESCSATYPIEVIASNPPAIEAIETSDWTASDNSITIVLTEGSIGNYEYSLDNINFQPESTFTGLAAGIYTVYINDINGCGDVQETVYLLNYPNFFTPNEDGYNDLWKIENSELEPNLRTYIYDRYGKLLTGFGSDSTGWDGTLNGSRLPSTDYWFVVIREDGTHHRGHFTLKR
ncbi:MAG TPA: T9SS type B sorting domain-containing protein [Flavobacterium sp.]